MEEFLICHVLITHNDFYAKYYYNTIATPDGRDTGVVLVQGLHVHPGGNIGALKNKKRHNASIASHSRQICLYKSFAKNLNKESWWCIIN